MNEILFILGALITLALPMIAARFGLTALQITAVFLSVTTAIITIQLMPIFGFITSAGLIAFASIFLTTDLISESYGRKKGFQTVAYCFIANILILIIGTIAANLNGINPDATTALQTIFSFVPRLLAGSLIAFAVSQTIDVFLFHKFKQKLKGKHLWLRNSGSTIISQAIDSAIVTIVAFAGIVPNLFEFFIVAYLIKVAISLLDTPFCYLGRHLAKNKRKSPFKE